MEITPSGRNRYDLAVAYRICPAMSRTPPPVHSTSKFDLAALCLRSFKASLGNLKIKMWVILDNCPPVYEQLFESLWDNQDLTLIRYGGIGNQATFGKQIEILTQQNDSEFVYVAEDDYFYLENKFHLALDLIKHNVDVDFCSPADHPDLHRDSFHRHKMQVKVERGHVWRTANGTTCTFLTRKATLQSAKNTFLSYTKIKRWNVDACMWLSLTKHHVFNVYDLITQPFLSRYRGASLVFAWYFNWRQVLFGKRYKLFMPLPSLAAHMDASRMPPYVDWAAELSRRI